MLRQRHPKLLQLYRTAHFIHTNKGKGKLVVEHFSNQKSLSYAPTTIDSYQFCLVTFTTFQNEFLLIFTSYYSVCIHNFLILFHLY